MFTLLLRFSFIFWVIALLSAYPLRSFAQGRDRIPIDYWSFDGENYLFNQSGNLKIETDARLCMPQRVLDGKRQAIQLASESCLTRMQIFKGYNFKEFSFCFAFKGAGFTYTSYPQQDLRMSLDYNNGLVFKIAAQQSEKLLSQELRINLDSSGLKSYDYYADDSWHFMIFSCSLLKGEMQIWIDGETAPYLKKSITRDGKLMFSAHDGFSNTEYIDEVLLFKDFFSKSDVADVWRKEFRKNFDLKDAGHLNMITSHLNDTSLFDTKEFAPGYPDYTIQATDQLKHFPLPRYRNKQELPRNFPWMDISYLHRELPKKGGKGFGRVNPQVAVELTGELAKYWNYYIELPTLRMDAGTAQKQYTDPSQIYSSLIEYANANPQLPVATIIMEVQNKPIHAGFDRPTPYVTAQDLPDKYYLCDKNGKPIRYNNRIWLNPFLSVDVVKKDALTSAFYLNQLSMHLTRKLDMINENGEWFGHKWSDKLLEQSPDVASFLKRTAMDYEHFNGWMQNRFDSIYKNTILSNISSKAAKFTFYNVSAYNSAYWPKYSERIGTNGRFNGTFRSTPAFYPSRPYNWRVSTGSLNGYGTVAEGRKQEIALGVKYFAPFVSPGWGMEENNIRPGQWLGLLKSMIMLGADFFHVGYFNVTGGVGWPNGIGPNDPRGYIYQAAMPAYAQAMVTYIREFLDKGILLEDSLWKVGNMPFAFKASRLNHLVLVRKLGQKYLIFGTIQPNSNYKGNALIETQTTIRLQGKSVRFNIRRQGSIYIFDMTDQKNPVFYQLDGWHQYEHPYYWNKSLEVEVENGASDAVLKTEKIGKVDYDFSKFTTYAEVEPGKPLDFALPELRSPVSSVSIFLKKGKGSPILILKSKTGVLKKKVSFNGLNELKLSSTEVKKLQLGSGEIFSLSVENGSVLLDKFKF